MSAPMSMEEWQNHLRAQKQQDRSNKNKSAEILHSFQAKHEDEGQKKLRESRRESLQAKKEAEQILRSYRPNAEDVISPANAKTNKSDGPLPPFVSAPSKDDPRSSIMQGSVSSIAANFTGTGTPTHMLSSSEHSQRAKSPPSQPKASEQKFDFSFTEIGNTPQTEAPSPTEVSQDWVQVTSEELAIPGPDNTEMMDANNTQELNIIGVTKAESNPMEISNNEMAPNLIHEEEPMDTLHQQPEAPQQQRPEAPQYSRQDVDFSFGLISTRAQPSLDAYMRAVQDVLLDALDDQPHMKQVIWYNAVCPPFVQGIQKDDSYVDSDGRGNVQRLLVKAAVPIFFTTVTPKKARSFVLKALAAALRQGYFLRMAEGA